jgi:two-component system, LytTR family, sensor kinase
MSHLLISLENMDIKLLLENPKNRLQMSFGTIRIKLIIYLNLTYLIICPLYLFFENETSGQYFPHQVLGYVYLFTWVTNTLSFAYNLCKLKRFNFSLIQWLESCWGTQKIEFFLTSLSLISLMIMSFLNMVGFGNPSSDSILTDFAFGHSLILLSTILIGRKTAFAWFIIVIGTLTFVTNRHGWDYQFNYLTPQESLKYKKSLENKDTWALIRQDELRKSSLNSPRITRYFNVWVVLILQAIIIAYFFNGITNDMFRIIPEVTDDIEKAIIVANEQSLEQEKERENSLKENYKIMESNLILREEILKTELNFLKSQINPHFLYNTLNYFYIKASEHDEGLAESILKLSDIMRYSLNDGVENKVSIDREIENMKALIDLHQIRYNNKLFIDFSVKSSDDSKKILPLVLIGLVENALKHGKLDDECYPLRISIIISKEYIKFSLQNRKSPKSKIISTKIGLQNVKRRLELSYPQSHTLMIEENENEYHCYLEITQKYETDLHSIG